MPRRELVLFIGLWHITLPLVLDFKLGIPSDFPEVAVWVLKIACIAAPETVARRVGDCGACLFRLLHHRIHFCFCLDVVPDAEFCGAWRRYGNVCVLGELLFGPEHQYQAVRYVEEDDRAAFKFGADDAFCRQAQAVAVEGQGRYRPKIGRDGLGEDGGYTIIPVCAAPAFNVASAAARRLLFLIVLVPSVLNRYPNGVH